MAVANVIKLAQTHSRHLGGCTTLYSSLFPHFGNEKGWWEKGEWLAVLVRAQFLCFRLIHYDYYYGVPITYYYNLHVSGYSSCTENHHLLYCYILSPSGYFAQVNRTRVFENRTKNLILHNIKSEFKRAQMKTIWISAPKINISICTLQVIFWLLWAKMRQFWWFGTLWGHEKRLTEAY